MSVIDERVFTETAQTQLAGLYRLSLSILASAADAQDAVQQGMLRAWERRGQVRDESRLRAGQHGRRGAAALLAQVRQSRGCTEPIDETTDETVMEAIFADSYRELMGEGQTFFAMKRLNRDIKSVRGLTVTASDDIYVVPVPDIEYEYRN